MNLERNEEKERIIGNARANAIPIISRFKELGGMFPQQIKETTLSRTTRRLLKVELTYKLNTTQTTPSAP